MWQAGRLVNSGILHLVRVRPSALAGCIRTKLVEMKYSMGCDLGLLLYCPFANGTLMSLAL